MSTLTEIQEAIQGLQQKEQEALAVWLNSKHLPPLNPGETRDLLATLDQEVISLKNGKGVSLKNAHRLVGSWAGK